MTKIGQGHVNDSGNGLRNQFEADYADYMAREQKKLILTKRPSSTEQAPSTIAAIKRQAERDPKDDLAYLLRPIDQSYLADPAAKSLDELIKPRAIAPQEFTTYDSMRKRDKNSMGDSKSYTLEKTKRDSAIHAFTYSKPANPSIEEIAMITKLKGIENAIAQPEVIKAPEQPKPSLFFRAIEGMYMGIATAFMTIEDFILGHHED